MGPLVVLAYSGGLDTSAIVPWLREHHGARVVCFAADVGQGIGELGDLVAKAKRSGATDCVIEDLREEFVRDFDKDRKSTRLNSSHGYISYAVFCLKKKKKRKDTRMNR